MAVRYGTFRICVLHTSYLEPYRTSVPYFSSIFQAYRTNVPYPYHHKKAYRTNVPYPYHYKQGEPYQRSVLFSKNGGVPFRTNVPYRTAILAEESYLKYSIKQNENNYTRHIVYTESISDTPSSDPIIQIKYVSEEKSHV